MPGVDSSGHSSTSIRFGDGSERQEAWEQTESLALPWEGAPDSTDSRPVGFPFKPEGTMWDLNYMLIPLIEIKITEKLLKGWKLTRRKHDRLDTAFSYLKINAVSVLPRAPRGNQMPLYFPCNCAAPLRAAAARVKGGNTGAARGQAPGDTSTLTHVSV